MTRNSTPRTVYTQIFHKISEDIANGVYQKGDMIPTQNELAEAFGVSRVTVPDHRILRELSEVRYFLHPHPVQPQAAGQRQHPELQQDHGLYLRRGFGGHVRDHGQGGRGPGTLPGAFGTCAG